MPAPTIVVGAPCWNDLFSSDTERAKEFYGQLFGWTTVDPGPEYGGYFLFQKDGKVVAGCMANDGEQGVPDMWTIYLSTDDADRTAEAAKANGGQVHMEPMDVTQNGRFTMLADPGGAAIGAWQPREVKRLRDPRRGRRARLVRAAHARLRQERRLLPRRLQLGHAHGRRHRRVPLHDLRRGRVRARRDHGLRPDELPEGQPSGRSTSRSTTSTRRSRKADELGGTIERPGEDTPYGRLATVLDPDGDALPAARPQRRLSRITGAARARGPLVFRDL